MGINVLTKLSALIVVQSSLQTTAKAQAAESTVVILVRDVPSPSPSQSDSPSPAPSTCTASGTETVNECDQSIINVV